MFNDVATQDKSLLEDIINRNYFNYLKNEHNKVYSLYFNQLYTNIKCKNCNCNCDRDLNYICNIKTYTNDEIFNNLKNAIDFYINNDFISNIELIPTDIEDINLFKILDYIYDRFKENNLAMRTIYLSDDGKFVLNDELSKRICNYIDKFKEINIFIKFTIYLDILDNSIDYKLFYANLLSFLSSYTLSDLKIVITPENIFSIKTHFETINFIKTLIKYDKDILITDNSSDKWDSNSIKYLTDFIDYYLNLYYKYKFKEDGEKFIDAILDKNLKDCLYISLASNGIFKNEANIQCNIKNYLYLNCMDLSIIACPGMQQDYYKIGFIDLKTGSIKPNNIPMQVTKDYIKQVCLPNCESCIYVDVCKGFCFSESFESHGNFLIPNPENCKMKSIKFKYIINYLKNHNLADLLIEKCDNKNYYNLILYII